MAGLVLIGAAVGGLASIVSWFSAKRGPEGVDTVPVDLSKYAGLWYEIARLPTSFQKGCTNTTAEYVNYGNKIRVINRCFRDGEQTTGKAWAYPTGNPGIFGVSFFPGIFGNYSVIRLSDTTSMVSNNKKTMLWILHRNSKMSETELADHLQFASERGYDVSKMLINSQ
jgi:apolipoprotein D and lipocalin family protein